MAGTIQRQQRLCAFMLKKTFVTYVRETRSCKHGSRQTTAYEKGILLLEAECFSETD